MQSTGIRTLCSLGFSEQVEFFSGFSFFCERGFGARHWDDVRSCRNIVSLMDNIVLRLSPALSNMKVEQRSWVRAASIKVTRSANGTHVTGRKKDLRRLELYFFSACRQNLPTKTRLPSPPSLSSPRSSSRLNQLSLPWEHEVPERCWGWGGLCVN